MAGRVLRPIGLDDLPRIPEVFSLALSPDGTRLAFVIETTDERANRRRHRLVVLAIDSDGRRTGRLTTVAAGGPKLGQPRWSPDGRTLAFVDARDGSPQLWTWDAATGERRRLTSHPVGVASPAWSPDGRRLAVIADAPQRLDDPVPIEEPDPRRRVVRVRGFRHRLEGRGWLTVDGARRHLWLVDAEGGALRQLTDGDADVDAPAWSPDGRSLAFAADRSADRDRHFGGEAIHLVDVTTRAVRRLTAEGVTCANPAWSPDASRVAYLRSESPLQVDGHLERLWVVDVATGVEQCWTDTLDRPVGFRPGGYRTPSAPAWTPDGAIIALLADGGATHLARFTPDAAERLTDGRQVIDAYAAAADRRRIAILRADARTPVEPWLWQDVGPTRRLWSSWPRTLAGVEPITPQPLTVARPDANAIDGWLLLPKPVPGSAASLVLMVHGGPHNAFGERFLADAQLLAGAGHAVLLVNPRGSGGYGEAFGRAVIGDWGGADLADLLAAVDQVLADHPGRLDSTRTAILGGSYGGYVATRAITRTDRFACAVAGAPVTWLDAMTLTADIGPSWSRAEQGGWPWELAEGYADRSPLTLAGRVRTPVLLYHGESDLRVPIAQSEAFLAAVTAGGGEAELLRVPGEGHVLPGDASPVHARLVREAILAFLAERLAPPEG